jgi:hypothetical protein
MAASRTNRRRGKRLVATRPLAAAEPERNRFRLVVGLVAAAFWRCAW